MAKVSGPFEVERLVATLIVTILNDLRELNYKEVEAGGKDILELLENGTIKNVVLDFHKSDYYGSTALAFFVKLWKRVKQCQGCMVFCGLSDHEKEILKVTHLDGLWSICSTRDEALQAVHG